MLRLSSPQVVIVQPNAGGKKKGSRNGGGGGGGGAKGNKSKIQKQSQKNGGRPAKGAGKASKGKQQVQQQQKRNQPVNSIVPPSTCELAPACEPAPLACRCRVRETPWAERESCACHRQQQGKQGGNKKGGNKKKAAPAKQVVDVNALDDEMDSYWKESGNPEPVPIRVPAARSLAAAANAGGSKARDPCRAISAPATTKC